VNNSGKSKFRFEDTESIENFLELVKKCSKKILDRWPNYRYDGYRNLWIFKPLGASSGSGVNVHNDEDKIKSLLLSSKMTTFVAQKYIERPMLIHKRKFDIRIYFLTFIRDKFVHIWVYKDCYIKFATHPFTCDNFAKSIHVTNYAVQKFFMNPNQAVPGAKENMWTLTQFIEYVQTIDKSRLWESVIYPAIKQNLLAVILPSLEGTDLLQNTFELNGADFMVNFLFYWV
jgi:tubulin monoglycylase TTLL3/8